MVNLLKKAVLLISFTGLIILIGCSSNKKPNIIPRPEPTPLPSIAPGAETFRDDFNGSSIDTETWLVADWKEHGGQTGEERCYQKDGYLNLVFINDPQKGFLSAALQTKATFGYGRWEARLKPSQVPGVLNSMYTIDWDNFETQAPSDGTKQEVDLEFLTKDFGTNYGKVHFAVHQAGHQSFTTNPDIELNFNPAADFHIWGFEITPQQIRWFVDNQVLQTYTYSDPASDITINSPYQLKFNVWSAKKWIEGPPAPGTKCVYQIDWIRFIPYEI